VGAEKVLLNFLLIFLLIKLMVVICCLCSGYRYSFMMSVSPLKSQHLLGEEMRIHHVLAIPKEVVKVTELFETICARSKVLG